MTGRPSCHPLRRTFSLVGVRPFSFCPVPFCPLLSEVTPMSRRTSQKASRRPVKRKKTFESSMTLHTPGQQQFAQIILRILRRIVR